MTKLEERNIFSWSELIENNRENLEAAIRDAQMEAVGIASGCFISIELGKDGKIYRSGIMTQGSYSMDSYEGNTIVIYRAYAWEPELNYIDWLENDGQNVQEFLAQQEEGHECAYDFMKEKYPEILAHWEKNGAEEEVEALDVDSIIDMAIRDQLENETHQRLIRD